LLVVADQAEGLPPGRKVIATLSQRKEASVSLDMEGSAPAAVLPMRLNSDALNDLVVLSDHQSNPSVVTTAVGMTFTVTNTNDSGLGSLRQAILDVNNNPGASMIAFNISSSGVPAIKPQTLDNSVSAFPIVIRSVTVDGTTQAAGLVEIDGSNFTQRVNGNVINGLIIAGGNSVVRGLVINRFSGDGVFAAVRGSNVIEGNLFGTDIDGTLALGLSSGLTISQVNGNTVGGTALPARNVCSGNFFRGIEISESSDNKVQGNLIGIDRTGTVILGNGESGLAVDCGSTNNVIGGTVTGGRNIISGNEIVGLSIFSSLSSPFCPTSGTLVQGNFIGTDITGNFPLGNLNLGIDNLGADGLIGGTSPDARNVISANRFRGVDFYSPSAKNNLLQGNFIGTDSSGTRALANGFVGVSVTQAPDNIIGGLISEARNVISGNAVQGVGIGIHKIDPFTGKEFVGETGAIVQGNFIGTDLTGIIPLGNGSDGVFVDATSVTNTIQLNRIAFNGSNGIRIPNDPLTPGDPQKPAIQTVISQNAIYSNALLGIDLGPSGPTPNPHNLLTGANLLQNFPELTSVTTLSDNRTIVGVKAAAITLTVTGNLSASPNTDYMIEFFFGSNCEGQGHEHTGAIPVSVGTEGVRTNGSGDVTFTHKFDLPSGNTNPTGFVNCTATDPVGNTSEFCQCVSVTVTPSIVNVSRSGKNLIVAGQNFSSRAVVMINDQMQKTLYDDQSPTTTLIAKKAGKSTHSGDRVQVRNSDGIVSAIYVMP
jgi:titin